MAHFGDAIAAALTTDVDEVLVVGHSSGAHLAVSILADLIRAGRVPPTGPHLAFLSLGQVVPMVSFLPQAQRLRADLQYLSSRDELVWVDVTRPRRRLCLCAVRSGGGVRRGAGRQTLAVGVFGGLYPNA